jgi:hypothetical protein
MEITTSILMDSYHLNSRTMVLSPQIEKVKDMRFIT